MKDRHPHDALEKARLKKRGHAETHACIITGRDLEGNTVILLTRVHTYAEAETCLRLFQARNGGLKEDVIIATGAPKC